jgi:hypothetical protein
MLIDVSLFLFPFFSYSSDQQGFLAIWNRQTRKRIELRRIAISSIITLIYWNRHLIM